MYVHKEKMSLRRENLIEIILTLQNMHYLLSERDICPWNYWWMTREAILSIPIDVSDSLTAAAEVVHYDQK